MNSNILESLTLIVKNIDEGCNEEQSNINESYRLFVQFHKHLCEHQINPALLTSYILYIFNKEHGIVRFISIVHPKGSYKKPLVQALDILHLLVNNFPKQVGKYVPDIIQQVCVKILRAFSASSDVKVKSINLFMKILEKVSTNMEHIQDYSEMYNVLCQCLEYQLPETAKEKAYECLGFYVKHLDYSLNSEEVKKLRNLLVAKIKFDSKCSLRVLNGLFLGLMYISERIGLEPVQIDKLYNIIKQFTSDAPDNRTKTYCRSALLYLHKNMEIFNEKVYVDHKFWHESLFKWLSLGIEEKKLATNVIPTVYECITKCLLKNGKNSTNERIFKGYLGTFKKGLDYGHASEFQTRIYIQGIQIMFKAAPTLLKPVEASNFAIKLINSYRLKFIINQNTDSEDLELLPDYIKMITSVLTSREIIERFEQNLLKMSLIVMVKTYPEISSLKKWNVCNAFLLALYSLESSSIFEEFASDLIYQCVVWSCSHHHIAELDFNTNKSTNQKILTVLDFLQFWKQILNINTKSYELKNIEYSLKTRVQECIIKELIKTLFTSINKLNITTSLKSQDSTNFLENVEINAKNDFAIFLNIIEFYVEILPNYIHPESLRCHLYSLLNFLIEKSSDFPMISGLYKLLSVCLHVVNKLEDFAGPNALLGIFMQKTLKLSVNFKGELLISCLKVLLECPPEIIQEILPECVPCFITIFTVGRNYTPVAELGITTLEKWQKNLTCEKLEGFLKQVVPLLDAYLRSKSLVYSSSNVTKKNKYNRAINKRTILIEIEPELVKLQRKILKFIGKQSVNVCNEIVENCKTTQVLSSSNNLKVTLRFEDVEFGLNLDKIVPKIVELSLHCSDRKMRITACELLQSLVVLFLGKTKQMTEKDQKDSEDLMKHFSYAILELACDPDEIVRQLFELLCMQMLHWYSNPSQWKKAHTSVIIETLLNGVCSSTNSTLRIFSGKCIGEFGKWAIKQTTEVQFINDPIIIKVFIKQMRFLSTHSDEFKRRASALIFNNIYFIIREEREILNIFWIEIFQIFVSSLNTCEENDDPSDIHTALKHLQRGFNEKCNIFNKNDEKRRKPYGFNGTKLINVMEYLLETITTSRSAICREKCMELFTNSVSHTMEAKSPQNYFETFIGDPYMNFLSKFETHNFNEVFCMKELERALDGFIFTLKNNILPKIDLNKTPTVIAVKLYMEREDEKKNTENQTERMKCALRIKILNFCSLCLIKNCKINIFNTNLWKIVLKLLNQSANENLANFFENVVKLPQEYVSELITTIRNEILNNFDEKTFQKIEYVKHMIFLQSSALGEMLKFDILFPNLLSNLLKDCMKIVISTHNAAEIESYSEILEFVLKNSGQFEKFVEFLYVDRDHEKLPVGLHILNIFEKTCIPIIFEKFNTFLELILNDVCNFEKTVLFIRKILRFMQGFQRNTLEKLEWILEKLCDKSEYFNEYFLNGSHENVIVGLEMIQEICSLKKTHFTNNWLVNFILKILNFVGNNLDETLEILLVFFENFEPIDELDLTHLKSTLDQILENVEKMSDSNEKTVNIMKLSKMFNILCRTKSHLLFEFTINSYITFKETEDYIDPQIFQNYMLNISHEEQCKTLEILFKTMIKTQENPRSYQLATKISITIFRNASIEILEDFFVKNIRTIVELLEQQVTNENILKKNCIFILIELMFARLPIGENNEINNKLIQVVYSEVKNEKELLRFFLKHALEAFKEDGRVKNSEFLRIYRCHSYNALISIATNCLNDSRFHVKLFTRLENDEDILWSGLVDLQKIYAFEKNFKVLPRKKTELVNIRTKFKQKNTTISESLRSQRIFNSSLSEDVTRFDLSNVIIRDEVSKKTEISEDLNIVSLDVVDVNDHECMATLCGLINHLSEIYSENSEDIPECFKRLRLLLLKETTPLNVRIFLMKAIENTSQVFMKYSKWFLAPVLKFLVDKCAGDEINFFITDLVVMLVNWSDQAVPQDETEGTLATALIEYFFNKLTFERKDMFKFNLQLIKLLFEAWNKSIKVHETFLERLQIENKEKDIEIHLSSILIINSESFVFSNGREMIFLKFLLSQINVKKKSTYLSSAETLGLLLRKWNEKNVSTSYYDDVEPVLKNIWESTPEKFGMVLEGITLHYPDFTSSVYITKILSRLNTVSTSSQHVFLKIILRSVHVIEDFNEFEMDDWEKYINNESIEIQVTTLTLIRESLHIIENNQNFTKIIEKVCEKRITENDLIRQLVYEISMRIYENEHVHEICKDCLIDGLSLSDPDLLKTVRHFWKTSKILSNSLTERFIQTISIFYRAKNEETSLGSSVYFIMDLLEDNADFHKPLFKYALEDCNFEEYELSDILTQDPYTVPMFAETFLETNTRKKKLKYFKTDEIRGTQSNFTFIPTQNVEIIPNISSQSSLMFDANETFKNPNEILSHHQKIYKRRFLKDTDKISYNFANLEVRSNIQRNEERTIKAKEREREVSITRKYRKGDFPDVQIPFSSIIMPLQLLSSENSDISKLILEEIFRNIENKFNENQWNRLNESLGFILRNSVQFNTNLMRTILDFIVYSECKITLEPDLISECCLSSGLVSNGTLVLEDYLRNLDVSEVSASKRMKTDGLDSIEDLHWIKLAELYKEMEEWDVVCSIFQGKLTTSCNDIVKKAIKFESEKSWPQAQDRYRDLIKNDCNELNKVFYYDAYFRCYANLGQWKELDQAIRSLENENNYWDDLWDEDWKQKILLPWLIDSKINEMLFDETPSKIFFENVNKSLCDSNKAEYLKYNFPQHLSIMWILNEDVDTAESFLSNYMDTFLSQWQILDPLFNKIRYEKITKLRSYSSIFEFIEVYRKIGCIEIEKVCETFIPLDKPQDNYTSIVSFENRVLYQKQFISILRAKISTLGDDDLIKSLKSDLEAMKFKLETGLIEKAIEENNFYMARKYCKPYRNRKEISIYMAKMMFIKSKAEKNMCDSVRTMLKSLEIISRNLVEIRGDRELSLSNHLTSFEISRAVSGILQNDNELFVKFKEDIEKLTECRIETSDELLENTMEKIQEILENPEGLNEKNIANAYMKLAYHLLEKNDKSSTTNMNNLNKYVLRAMKKGSKDARQLFPCLLESSQNQLTENSIFSLECSTVPTWMFLGWIPQILACLNTENVQTLGTILLRIAETYPQAIIYPYRLSRENFNRNLNTLTEKLDLLLLKNEMEIFLKALSKVNVPICTLEQNVNKILNYVKNDKLEAVKIQENYIVSTFFQEECGSSRDPENLYGNVWKRMKTFRKYFNNDLTTCEKNDVVLKMQNLLDEMKRKNFNNSQLLKDYSPWLANFSIKLGNVEIPGQYDGREMPLPQYHVKIYKFRPEVIVMNSLRKPIKITIIGNDTKDYSYLVKSGEDLRQDQRIQQLFILMNEIFVKNTSQTLKTFEVVPLTTSLGLIKWVENTCRFDDFMRKGIDDERAAKKFPDEPMKEYLSFINSATSRKFMNNNKMAYGEFVKKYDRNKVQAKYRSLVNEIEPNLLRKAFWNISANTESFIALRHNFMKSYATMCTAHWLLGIGDRHLGNTLISLDDGKVIGIDFGHAFGSATQNLTVPELIPFRLTPQIVNFMEPFKEKGHFRETMVKTMKSLRKFKHLLLATVSVFVKEPSIDWLEKMKSIDNFECLNWTPLKKIEQFERKLNGVNSTIVMIEDLEAGVVQEYAKIYCKLVEGSPEFDIRARFSSKHDLSVDEQIDCLIDHASDYNLLGRTFSGWRPWV